jgi:hypothetical protein
MNFCLGICDVTETKKKVMRCILEYTVPPSMYNILVQCIPVNLITVETPVGRLQTR